MLSMIMTESLGFSPRKLRPFKGSSKRFEGFSRLQKLLLHRLQNTTYTLHNTTGLVLPASIAVEATCAAL
jgi:hypothetical protein